MGKLTDRQFETTRRVAKGRTDVDRDSQIPVSEEYATAVVDEFGESLVGKLIEKLSLVVLELQRANRLLEVIADEEVGEAS